MKLNCTYFFTKTLHETTAFLYFKHYIFVAIGSEKEKSLPFKRCFFFPLALFKLDLFPAGYMQIQFSLQVLVFTYCTN